MCFFRNECVFRYCFSFHLLLARISILTAFVVLCSMCIFLLCTFALSGTRFAIIIAQTQQKQMHNRADFLHIWLQTKLWRSLDGKSNYAVSIRKFVQRMSTIRDSAHLNFYFSVVFHFHLKVTWETSNSALIAYRRHFYPCLNGRYLPAVLAWWKKC